MTQERLTMRKIREVLRLKWVCHQSNRAIARSCHISHSTVREYLDRAQAAGLSWPLPADLDEATLFQRLFPPSAHPTPGSSPCPDWAVVQTELRRKGVTLRLLWEEYRAAHPDGYGYSQFCALYRTWAKQRKTAMRQVHKAGEKVFVDYAGQTVPITDPTTGAVHPAQIFVGVLGASSYTFAEAQESQELAHWIGGHVRMFAFFGGVPALVVPDNLKAGVTHPCRYEPDLNPTYQEFAQHYGVAILPARARKPKDKAKVEVGVQIVERWILARLRDRTFFSLAELNLAIRDLLAEMNAKPMEDFGRSRQELFDLLDRPALQPLPAQPYEFAVWKKARVHLDYHVEFEHHYYSVPYALIHQEVELRVTAETVEVFSQHQRVASHRRVAAPGQHTTLPEHMPPAHQAAQEWTPDRFLHWAQNLGPHTTQLIQAVLTSRQHPQQAYRSCLGILRLVHRYDAARLEAACGRALETGLHSYKGVKNILVAQLDTVAVEAPPTAVPAAHDNIRGPDYYR